MRRQVLVESRDAPAITRTPTGIPNQMRVPERRLEGLGTRARGMAKARGTSKARGTARGTEQEGRPEWEGGLGRGRGQGDVDCGRDTRGQGMAGDATRLGKKKDSNTKNQPWECLQGHATSHATLFDFQFFSLALALRPSPPLPHVKCESEGTFFAHAHAWAV